MCKERDIESEKESRLQQKKSNVHLWKCNEGQITLTYF